MNYQKVHDNIINRASNRTKISDCKYELHHITPKCEGGAKDGPPALLTQKEHRIVHKLRYKITGVLGNMLSYNLMRYGRGILNINHHEISVLGGKQHHKLYKERDLNGYLERQRKAGRISGALSRDGKLGFHSLSEEQLKTARDKGCNTTVTKKIGMFSDDYRKAHAKNQMKKISTPNGIFDSMSSAALYYNVVLGTITYRVNTKSAKWENWNYIEELK